MATYLGFRSLNPKFVDEFACLPNFYNYANEVEGQHMIKGTVISITLEMRARVIDLALHSSLPYKRIAVEVGISPWSVCDILTTDNPPIRRKRGTGSPAYKGGR
jgi:hypothetical protein